MSAPSEWEIVEAAFDPVRLAVMEFVFAVGNGYLGLRGAPEEGGPSRDPGVVLNGFHETWPIVYPEDAYGMACTGQTTVNATDGTVIRLFVDDGRLRQAALDYFRTACSVDLEDSHGNTADWIHVASCGGTWLALGTGFGGLRDYDGEVAFSPRLPAAWSGLRFRLQVRGQLVEVDMRPGGTTYRLLEGRGLPIRHFGESLRLAPDTPLRRPAAPDRQLPQAA